MTEVLNKEQVVSKEAPKNDQDLLKWLESNVKGHEELRKKLEENEQLKALLKGVDAAVWKGLFKKAKPEERAELAVLFDYLKLEMTQLSFEQTKEELELKNEIQAQLDSLRYQVLSESKNTYDNLENDNYGKKSDETLELSRARRADENIAVADLLLPEVDRPNKDAALLFQSLDHQQYALWVLQSLLKSKEKGQLSSHDILEKSSILRYYENDTAALRHDIGRITYLFNTHKSEIQKLEKQQQMLTFVKKIKDWNGMTRVIAHILSSEKYSNKEKFTEQELKADPEVMALYGKKRFFVNEIGRIAAALNATSRENLQKIVDLKGKSGVDLKEAYNAKKFLEVNQEIAKTNPFLLLSDLNMTGELDRKEKGLANNHRRSEQQLYAAFLSNADTENVRKSDGSSGWWNIPAMRTPVANLNIPGYDASSDSVKHIIDGKKTADLIAGFKLLVSGSSYPVNEIKENKLAEFSAFLQKYPETIALYRKALDKKSYNANVDLNDLLTASQLKNLSKKENLKAVEELNSIRDETADWFYATLKNFPEDSAERKWFDSLDASSKLSTMRKIIEVVDKIPNPLLSLAGLSVSENNTISKADLLKTVDFKINYFKDDAGISPRFSMGFDLSKLKTIFYHSDGSQIGKPITEVFGGFNPHIDIPLVNASGELDLNTAKVQNADMHEVKAVKKLYGRLGANIKAYFKNPYTGKVDEGLSGRFHAALEGALGVKRNYKEGLEFQSDQLWKAMLAAFESPNFDSKESFIQRVSANIDQLKDKKSDFSAYFKNNPEFQSFIVQDIADALEQIGVFEKSMDSKKKAHAEILLHSLLKGSLEEIKNSNMQHLNGKTKLTRLGLFAQLGLFIGNKKSGEGPNQETITKSFGPRLSLGVETSISNWKILYAPDKEKYQYMDESLRKGNDVEKESLESHTPEALVNSMQELLKKTNIQGLRAEMNKNHQLEIHVPENTLKRAGKQSAWELFNIYVHPNQENNLAVEKNKITLGKVGELSLVTRNYFDDFAVYLLVGGKGVEDCKIKNTGEDLAKESEKAKTIEGFRFTPEQAEVKAEKKEMTFEYQGFDFDKMRKEVREVIQWVDNQPYNKALAGQFLAQMNTWELENAIKTVSKMFDQYSKRHTWAKKEFSHITEYLNAASKDKNEKIQTLNTLKALFAFTNVHNVPGLDINLQQRKEVFAGLEKDFPLDKNLALVKRNELITKAKAEAKNGEIPYPHIPNIIGYTAFYRKDTNEGRGYSLNALGNNHIFWGSNAIATIDTAPQQEKMKTWLQTKMDKDTKGYAVLLDQLKNNLKGIVDENQLSDWQLKELLWNDKGLDIQGKKIKLEKKYIFYLLWECANESLGLQLGNLIVEGKPAQKAENQLAFNSDMQALTKTQILDEKTVNAKWNIISTTLGAKQENHNEVWSEPDPNSPEVPEDPEDSNTVSEVDPDSPEAEWDNDAGSVD